MVGWAGSVSCTEPSLPQWSSVPHKTCPVNPVQRSCWSMRGRLYLPSDLLRLGEWINRTQTDQVVQPWICGLSDSCVSWLSTRPLRLERDCVSQHDHGQTTACQSLGALISQTTLPLLASVQAFLSAKNRDRLFSNWTHYIWGLMERFYKIFLSSRKRDANVAGFDAWLWLSWEKCGFMVKVIWA